MSDSLAGANVYPGDQSVATSASLTIAPAASMGTIAREWDELQGRAVTSAYQRRDFLDAWINHAATPAGQTVRIGVVRNETGRLVALLPFAVRKRWGFCVAGYLGGAHSNLNMPIVDPAFGRDLDRRAIEALLHDYCLAAGADVLVLANQPAEWLGQPHPFACLTSQPSPDSLMRIETTASYEGYSEGQLSKDARSKLRRKTKKVEDLGATLLTAQTAAETDLLLTAFLDHKARRLAAMGADDPFAVPGVAAFLREAALAEGGLQLFGLVSDGKVHAVAGWVRQGEQASLMILSYDPQSDLARYSPGEVVLSRILASHLGQGLRHLDFGLGDERYKSTWSNASTAMFDAIFAVTGRGALYAQAQRARTGAVRMIKQNQALYGWLKRTRARLAGAAAETDGPAA